MEGLTRQAQNLTKTISSNKVVKLIYTLDAQIKKNFLFDSVATRPVNSNGLWCFILIPAILLLYKFLYDVSPLYTLMAYLSIGLLCYSILFILFLYMSCLILKGAYTSGCTFAIMMSTIPVYSLLGYDLFISLALSTILVFTYSFFLKKCLLNCPRTFTIGEAMVVSQGISLALTASVITVYSYKYLPEFKDDDDTKLIKAFVITVLSTVGLLVAEFLNLSERHRNMQWLLYLVATAGAGAVIALHVALGPLCFKLFFGFVLKNFLRVKLLLFWLWLVVMAVVVVVYRSEIGVKVTTSTRKSFHILASVVFMSGILLDLEFIALASGIIFGITIFIEGLRLSGIEPVSPALQKAFQVYADEKDVGVFAMTPIYLYIGLACPLALVPWRAGGELELLSGVLSIGVGDSAASWAGTRYGSNKWPGSNRTLEGTIANIGSQIITVYILNVLELLPSGGSLPRAAAAATLSGLAEARMDQVDNLVLPLVTILAMQLTAFLDY